MSKTEQITFRTTEDSVAFLKMLADSDDRTPSYILNKMIDVFKTKRITKLSQLK